MFNAAQIWTTAWRHPTGTTSLAVTALATAILMLGGAGPAGAVLPTGGGEAGGGGGGGSWGKKGGVVHNRTDMSIRVAQLAGTARCRVLLFPTYDPDHPCQWLAMRPGANSRSYYPDTDAFRFNSDGQAFYYNGLRIPARVYVKIRDPQKVVCARLKGFSPRCFG
jgi:hypothetical protein